MISPSVVAQAYSITFWSSRTLPGQECSCSMRSASGSRLRTGGVECHQIVQENAGRKPPRRPAVSLVATGGSAARASDRRDLRESGLSETEVRKSRLVAEITRMSKLMIRSPPRRRCCRSWSTRSSLGWRATPRFHRETGCHGSQLL